MLFPLVDSCFLKFSKAKKAVFENSIVCRLGTEYMECLCLICSLQIPCKQHMNPKGFSWSSSLLDWKSQWDVPSISSNHKCPPRGGWREEGRLCSASCTCFFFWITVTNMLWVKVCSEGGKKRISCMPVEEPGASADTLLLTESTDFSNSGCW